MGTARKRSESIPEEEESIETDDNKINYSAVKKSKLSVRDATIILTMSTILSITLVTSTLGVSGLKETLAAQKSYTELLITFCFITGVFALVSYFLVRTAAHYLVYLAIGIFCALLFPVSRRRQRRAVEEIYTRAGENKEKKSSTE